MVELAPSPPKGPMLAMCNIFDDPERLRDFALAHGFGGVEWSFRDGDIPGTPGEEAALKERIERLAPLEVRYHLAFAETDLGDAKRENANRALRVLRGVCRLIAELKGSYVTIHVGLGLDSTLGLNWDRTIERLTYLVGYASGLNLKICLENLAWGWTSRPDLFEKLVRKSGSLVTLDIGHARVSPSVMSQQFSVEDFVTPHPERVVAAHVYHEEHSFGHVAPESLKDIAARLSILKRIGCGWWVLELREEGPLLTTLGHVRSFFTAH